MSSSASDSYGLLSVSWSLIFLAKIFHSASAAVSPSVTTASIRNGGRGATFLDVKSQIFFGFFSFLTAAQRRTSIVSTQVFSSFPEKALLISIETMVGASRDPARDESVTALPRDLFLTDACTYVTWISPDMALLVSTYIFGKFVQMTLNFEPDGSSKRMTSWTELILWSQISFWSCWIKHIDKALEEIKFTCRMLLIVWFSFSNLNTLNQCLSIIFLLSIKVTSPLRIQLLWA